MGTSNRAKTPPPGQASWPEENRTDLTGLPSFWPEQMTAAVLAEAVHPAWLEPSSTLPDPADPLWERWFERAIEQGLDEDLASLGRSLICEAHMQRWDPERRAECGWFDDGEEMLELALLDPEHAQARWRALLDF
jgi:hypothetical protein